MHFKKIRDFKFGRSIVNTNRDKKLQISKLFGYFCHGGSGLRAQSSGLRAQGSGLRAKVQKCKSKKVKNELKNSQRDENQNFYRGSNTGSAERYCC